MNLEGMRAFFQQDTLAGLLDIEILEVAPGYAKTSLKVRSNLLNSLGMTHGGTVFSLVDLALAVSCNSHGIVAVALNVNINYLRPTYPGDTLYATSVEEAHAARTGVYRITVVDQNEQKVAVATGTAFRTGRSITSEPTGRDNPS